MTPNGPISEAESGVRERPNGGPISASGGPVMRLSTSERWQLAALLVFTLVVRGSVLWLLRDNLNQDPDAYREIAENLLVHGEFARGKQNSGPADSLPRPTAYRPPLYPVFLSNLSTADGSQLSLMKVAVLHLVLGLATVWLTWLTARRVGCAHHPSNATNAAPRTIAPLLAGLLVACDPLLLNQQAVVMTETLAAFLTILSLWCLTRFDAARTPFNAAMTGGAIGLAILCRPTYLPWLGVIGLVMLIVRISSAEHGARNAERRTASVALLADLGRRALNLTALGIVAAAVVSPWAIRNYRVFGEPIVTTTHGGYTLLLGNNPEFYSWLMQQNPKLPWTADSMDHVLTMEQVSRPAYGLNGDPRFALLGPGEIENDQFNYTMARVYIAADRPSFLHACVYRVIQLWSPLPHKLTADESKGRQFLRYATCTWYLCIFAFSAIGIWRLRWRNLHPPWIWGILLCLVFTAVHTFYWTNMRMRAPLMPFIALVAAAGLNTVPRGRSVTNRQ